MKKLLSSILCFVFIITCICPVFAASDMKQEEYTHIDLAETSENDSVLSYFDMLGIELNLGTDGYITRGDAVANIIKALGLDEAAMGISAYTTFNEKAAYIAHSLGMLSGETPDDWSLDAYITFNQTTKIFAVALGYAVTITEPNPYPAAYLRIAADLNLLDGVELPDGESDLKADAFFVMLNNAMQAQLMEISSIGDDGNVYTSNHVKGETLEQLYLRQNDYILKRGILEGCFYAMTTSGDKCEENEIRIDGTYYKYDGVNVKRAVGCNVDYVYSKEFKKIVGIRLNSKNHIYNITDGDNLTKESGYVRYEDENGNEKKINVADGATYVYNNYVLTGGYTPADVDFAGRNVAMIDNNDDKVVDIVFLTESESAIVNYVKDDIIYLDYGTVGGKKTVDLSDVEDVVFTIRDTDGYLRALEDIGEDTSISVIISKDREYIDIIILDDEIVAAPISYWADTRKVVFGDAVYKLGRGIPTPNLGVNYYIRVNEKNEIFYIKAVEGQYFYIMAKAEAETFGTPRVKICTPDGLENIYELANKVNIDGVTYSSGNAMLSNVRTDAVCSIKLNSNNEVREIKYTDDYGELAERIYREDSNGFNDVDKKESRPFRFNEYTSFFYISEEDGECIIDVDIEDGEKYSTQSFDYDRDTGFVKAVVVKIETDQRATSSITYKSDMAIVKEVVRILNNEGEAVYKMTVYTDGEEKTFYCGTYGDVNSVCGSLVAGDIVRYIKNYNNVIVRLERYVSLSEMDTCFIDGRDTVEEISCGYVMTLDKNVLTNYSEYLCHELNVSTTMSFNDVVSMRMFALLDNPSDSSSEFSDIYVYDKVLETVELASMDDVMSYDDAGDEASKVFIARSKSDVKFFVIIKDN